MLLLGQPEKVEAATQTAAEGNAAPSSSPKETNATRVEIPEIFRTSLITSTIEVFSRLGGLALLARHLPVVYPDTLRQIGVGSKLAGSYPSSAGVEKEMLMNGLPDDWVKIDSAEDFYEVKEKKQVI